MPRIIEITVSPNGETTVQTKGFAGSECTLASQFLEKALGVVSSDQKTIEFYSLTPIQQQIQQ